MAKNNKESEKVKLSLLLFAYVQDTLIDAIDHIDWTEVTDELATASRSTLSKRDRKKIENEMYKKIKDCLDVVLKVCQP